MKRREFLKAVGTVALAAPAVAQTADRLPVIAILLHNPPATAAPRVEAILLGLKEAGLREGVHFRVEKRFANAQFDRLPGLAQELEAFNPIVFVVGPYGIGPVQKLKSKYPIVFAGIAADPVENGVVKSYTRPGGMITGSVVNALGGERSLVEKRIFLLRELVPTVKHLGVIGPEPPPAALGRDQLVDFEYTSAKEISEKLNLKTSRFRFTRMDEFEGKLAEAVSAGVDALYMSGEVLLFNNIPFVVPLVAGAKLPAVGAYAEWARGGLLMSYSADTLDSFRRGGHSAAKIFRGANPGEIPIEQISRFIVSINSNAARLLGIEVPTSILALADEIID